MLTDATNKWRKEKDGGGLSWVHVDPVESGSENDFWPARPPFYEPEGEKSQSVS